MDDPDIATVRALALGHSNGGRWGEQDQRGTLNHVTAPDIVAAAGLMRQGRVVSMACRAARAGRGSNPARRSVRTRWSGPPNMRASRSAAATTSSYGPVRWRKVRADGTWGDCAADGVHEFFFCGPPLQFTNAVGSPLNPMAAK